MLILTEMFCAAIFIAIYWSLCAYCEIISLLNGAKTYKRSWKFMFDVGPLCCAAYYIARLEYCFMDLNTSMAFCDESGERHTR